MARPKAQSTALDKIRDKKATDSLKTLSFDELMKQLESEGELLDSAELGDGFHLLQGEAEKEKLVGVPFVILDWVINKSKKFGGREFLTFKIKTAAPIFYNGTGYFDFIVNDGGAGITPQILSLPENTKAIKCRKGLRVSKDYPVTDDNDEPVLDPKTGEQILGTTFYLDTSL